MKKITINCECAGGKRHGRIEVWKGEDWGDSIELNFFEYGKKKCVGGVFLTPKGIKKLKKAL